MQLYIENQKVDLAPDQVFAVTVQSNDITKPDTVQSSYSNSLTLPYTERNHAVLGNAADVASQSSAPYAKLESAVLQDGVEVVPVPVAFLNEANEGYELQVFSGALDLFAKFGDKSIRDLDLSRFNHTWDAANVVAGADGNRTYLDGYIYSPVQSGKPGLWAEDMHPAVFVRTVFEQMLLEAGVSYTGITDELWDRLVLPFSNDKPVHNSAWLDAHRMDKDMMVGWAGLPITYGKAKATISINLERVTDRNESGIAFIIIDGPDGYDPKVKGQYSQVSTTGAFELSGTLEFRHYENISKMRWATYGNSLQKGATDDPSMSWYSGGTYTVEYEDEVFFGTEWDVALNLPEIKQKDFFKAIRSLFDLMVSFDPYSNTLTLIPFNKLLENRPQALNWSHKLVYVGTERAPVQYRFGEFAQKSWWRYKADELGGSGDHYLSIDDAQLEAEKDVVELPFAASEDGVVQLFRKLEKPEYTKTTSTISSRNSESFDDGDKVYVINATADPQVRYGWAVYERIEGRNYLDDGWALLEQQADFYERNKIGPRICVLYDTVSAYSIQKGKSTSVAASSRSSTFSPISFASLLPTRYRGLQGVLERTKGITPHFLLSAADVANYDPSVPIWLDQYQAYFYLNSINEYTGEGPTECQLWRL